MANKMAKAQATTPSLHEQIAMKRAELIETRRSHAAGELVNPRALPRIRKEIARLLTQVNAPAPDVKETKEEEQSKKGATV